MSIPEALRAVCGDLSADEYIERVEKERDEARALLKEALPWLYKVPCQYDYCEPCAIVTRIRELLDIEEV